MQPDRYVYEVTHSVVSGPAYAVKQWDAADGLYETAEAAKKAVVDLLDRTHLEAFGRNRDGLCSIIHGSHYEITPSTWSPPSFVIRAVRVATEVRR